MFNSFGVGKNTHLFCFLFMFNPFGIVRAGKLYFTNSLTRIIFLNTNFIEFYELH